MIDEITARLITKANKYGLNGYIVWQVIPSRDATQDPVDGAMWVVESKENYMRGKTASDVMWWEK